jgi:hypothetical protein
MVFDARQGQVLLRQLLTSAVWHELQELKMSQPDDPTIGNNWFSQQVRASGGAAAGPLASGRACSSLKRLQLAEWVASAGPGAPAAGTLAGHGSSGGPAAAEHLARSGRQVQLR